MEYMYCLLNVSYTRFDAHCAILGENSYHFSISSAYCEFVTMVEFQSVECIIRGFFQSC
jgi:hypothetical protein